MNQIKNTNKIYKEKCNPKIKNKILKKIAAGGEAAEKTWSAHMLL